MAYLRELSPGRWFVQLSSGTGAARRRQTKILRGTEKAVQRQALLLEAAFAAQTAEDRDDPALAALLDRWLTLEGPRLTPSSQSQYRQAVKRWTAAAGTVRLSALTAARVAAIEQGWLTSGRWQRRVRWPGPGLSVSTVLLYRTVLRRALKWDRRRAVLERLEELPALQAPPAERTVFTLTQARRFLELLDSTPEMAEWRALWQTALGTGLRLGELRGLRREDVDLAAGWLVLRQQITRVRGQDVRGRTKSKRERGVPLPPHVVTVLREHLATHDHELVFAEHDGRPFSEDRAWRALYALLEQHHLPHVTPHGLRHGYATFLLASGVDISYVAWLLGHSKVALTFAVYGHMERRAAADAAQRLGQLLMPEDGDAQAEK